MAGPFDFTGQNIEDSYQRVLQTDGASIYDGTGSAFTLPSAFPYTGSARITGSLNVIGTTTITGSLLVLNSTTQLSGPSHNVRALTGDISLFATASFVNTQTQRFRIYDPVSSVGTSDHLYIEANTADGGMYWSQNDEVIANFNTINGKYSYGNYNLYVSSSDNRTYSPSGFVGPLIGTASWATSASQAITASAAITVDVNDVPGNNATNYLSFFLATSGFRPSRVASTKFVVNPATGSMGINKSTITAGYNLDVNGSVLITGSLNQGSASLASGLFSHVQGIANTASGIYSHAEGQNTKATGQYSHAEGFQTQAVGNHSHAEGQGYASGQYSHAEGGATATGNYSHAEGQGTSATGVGSHAEGYSSQASGDYSHVEGNQNTANALASHAEGIFTQANGEHSHAEGAQTRANGAGSHAEGGWSYYNDGDFIYPGGTANGNASHAEGLSTLASGEGSHAEGYYTTASGGASHAEGLWTVALGSYQHVQGQYNVSSSAQSAFIIGNGTSNSARSNLVFAAGSYVQISGSLVGRVLPLTPVSNTASLNLSGSNFFTISLTNGVTTLLSASNVTPGQTVNIRVTQGNAGTGKLAFTPIFKSGSFYTGSAIANAVDIVTLISFDSSSLYLTAITNLV